MGSGGYVRYHLSDEPNENNLLACKFEMSLLYSTCMKIALRVKCHNNSQYFSQFLLFIEWGLYQQDTIFFRWGRVLHKETTRPLVKRSGPVRVQ